MPTALICFDTVARINQVDIDLRAITRQFGITAAELSKEELVRIAQDVGFKAKIKRLKWAGLGRYPLPAIFELKDGSFGVLLKLHPNTKRALVYFPPGNKSVEITEEAFLDRATGSFLILTPKLSVSQVRFGFGWFYNEIIKYKQVILEVMLGSFVVQLFGLVTPLFTQVILDKVIVHRTMTTLEVLAVAYLFVSGFEFLLNLARNYIFVHTANKIDAKLGAKLFRHLLALPFVYFESRKVGNIAARVRELDNIREFITNKSVSVIIDLLFSTVFVAVMFLYSVPLTLIVLGCVAVIAIVYVTVTPELRARLDDKFQTAAQSQSYLVEAVTGVQTVKSLAIEGAMQKRWEDYLAHYLKSSFNLSIMGTTAGSFCNLVQRLMTIAILFLGVRLVIENKLTIGQLIAFQMFSGQFTGPVLRLVNLWNEFQQTLLAVDRLGDILHQPVEVQSSKAITLPSVAGAIRFEGVTFRYSPDTPNVLEALSLDVQPGRSIGLVGRSGSGKSTIAKLIQRLYLPMEGAIYLDDMDVRHLHPLWLRNNIGIVLQESFLFSGTIRENIAMPRPDAPMELIIQASKVAGAHEFVGQFPAGYDTMVGERGSTLSGGQKQRVAIARALITDPKIVIFDEATSALDYESERAIQDNLGKIKSGRTMIIIAHRLSTIKDCDIIYVIDKGKIAEFGSHKELMAKKGYYYSLYRHQFEEDHVPAV